MSTLRIARARSLLRRFAADRRGSAIARYFLFTTLWCIGMAAAMHFGAPNVTKRLGAVASAMQAGPSR